MREDKVFSSSYFKIVMPSRKCKIMLAINSNIIHRAFNLFYFSDWKYHDFLYIPGKPVMKLNIISTSFHKI